MLVLDKKNSQKKRIFYNFFQKFKAILQKINCNWKFNDENTNAISSS